MLHAKGNPDNGNAEQQATRQVDQGDFPPAKQNPDEVHHNGQASRLTGAVHHFIAEGPQGIGSQLEELESERDTDNGDTQQNPCGIIHQGDKDTAKNEPKYVSERVHLIK